MRTVINQLRAFRRRKASCPPSPSNPVEELRGRRHVNINTVASQYRGHVRQGSLAGGTKDEWCGKCAVGMVAQEAFACLGYAQQRDGFNVAVMENMELSKTDGYQPVFIEPQPDKWGTGPEPSEGSAAEFVMKQRQPHFFFGQLGPVSEAPRQDEKARKWEKKNNHHGWGQDAAPKHAQPPHTRAVGMAPSLWDNPLRTLLRGHTTFRAFENPAAMVPWATAPPLPGVSHRDARSSVSNKER